MLDATDWKTLLERHREQKDEFFAEHPHSPTPQDLRERFDGRSNFEPNPDLRFERPLHEPDEKEAVSVEITTEGEREYRR